MAETLLPVYAKLLYSPTFSAAAVTGNSPTFTLPLADSYTFILDVGTPGGTTETADVAIQASPDGGTTFYDWWRFAQVTTAVVTRCLNVQPMQGRGEAGSEAAVTAAATGAITQNKSCPPVCRIAVTIGGTLPTYATFKVWLVATPRSSSGSAG
jgi:hypothetical protein